MGCCQSSSVHHDASDALSAPARAQPRVAADQALRSSVDSRRPSYNEAARRPAGGLNRPNQPVRAPSPLRTSPAHVSHLTPPWTRAQLERERAAFFDTRVTGQPDIWSAIRLVCEMLQKSQVTEAQGILDAVSVTCPSGRIAIGRGGGGGGDRARGGIYDERGELYELPPWLVTDPLDLIEDEKTAEREADEHEDSEQRQRREEKGKGKAADVGEIIQLRARLSDRGTDVVVSTGTNEKVGAIVRKIQEQIGAMPLRLLYLGHVLQETKTLQVQGYRSGDVLNAYVFEAPDDHLRKQRAK